MTRQTTPPYTPVRKISALAEYLIAVESTPSPVPSASATPPLQPAPVSLLPRKRPTRSRSHKLPKRLSPEFAAPSPLAIVVSDDDDEGKQKTPVVKTAKKTSRRRARQKWSDLQSMALIEAVYVLGAGSWNEIAQSDKYGPLLVRRTRKDLKDKWRNLTKTKTADELFATLPSVDQ
jgi:hypothetical protein